MQVLLCQQIRCVRRFGGFEAPKINCPSVVPYLCHVGFCTRMLSHPQNTQLVVLARPTDVLLVALRRNLAQVDPAVVRPIPVDVINLSLRPNPSHPHEGKAVRQIARFANANIDITDGLVTTAGNIAAPRTASRNQPRKNTRVLVVVQQGF